MGLCKLIAISFKDSLCIISLNLSRSSRSYVFFEKGIFKNFVKFTGKHLRRNLFFNKVAGLQRAALFKKLNLRNFKHNYFTKHLRAIASVFPAMLFLSVILTQVYDKPNLFLHKQHLQDPKYPCLPC